MAETPLSPLQTSATIGHRRCAGTPDTRFRGGAGAARGCHTAADGVAIASLDGASQPSVPCPRHCSPSLCQCRQRPAYRSRQRRSCSRGVRLQKRSCGAMVGSIKRRESSVSRLRGPWNCWLNEGYRPVTNKGNAHDRHGRPYTAAPCCAPGRTSRLGARDAASTRCSQVHFEQRLHAQLPLDLVLHDATGKSVRLGTYFGTQTRHSGAQLLPLCPALPAGARRAGAESAGTRLHGGRGVRRRDRQHRST